ncbi:hypothetical protein LG314_05335 [Agrococcus terreus]|uniref:hypothetical protein n=1 Tax=Agrococcus terreus TaxID=574649 RepID=UPI0038508F80
MHPESCAESCLLAASAFLLVTQVLVARWRVADALRRDAGQDAEERPDCRRDGREAILL